MYIAAQWYREVNGKQNNCDHVFATLRDVTCSVVCPRRTGRTDRLTRHPALYRPGRGVLHLSGYHRALRDT